MAVPCGIGFEVMVQLNCIQNSAVRQVALFLFCLTACLGWAQAPTEDKDSINTNERSVAKLAEGIFVIRHKDASDEFPQGNTTVVIGDKSVLVVDACYLPSSAREDIAQIRKWTDKPVKYLVNTHWHYDHTMGNGTYAQAFPGLEIISHWETARQIETYNPGWFSRYYAQNDKLRAQLADGKGEDGKPLTDAARKEVAALLAKREPVEAEFRTIVDPVPTMTFDSELNLNLGSRKVELKFLGRGNTRGDVVIYLPAEKILATGDLVDYPVPYLGGGYPADEAKTLKNLLEIEAETYIPGHGTVLHGKAYIGMLQEFISAVVKEVDKQIPLLPRRSKNLEGVEKAVRASLDVAGWTKRFAGTDKDNVDFFDGFTLSGIIEAAYEQSWGK